MDIHTTRRSYVYSCGICLRYYIAFFHHGWKRIYWLRISITSIFACNSFWNSRHLDTVRFARTQLVERNRKRRDQILIGLIIVITLAVVAIIAWKL